MNDEQYLLASAYLDGELSPAEIAAAEADPAVMAGVAQMRAVGSEMRDVEPPTSASRESAIAAALAEFDAPRTPAVAPAGVVAYRPRPSYSKWLGVAAAAVAIGLLGVVVAQSGGSDDDDAGEADAALDAAGAQPESAVSLPVLAEAAPESATAFSVSDESSAAASAEETASAADADDAATSLATAPTAAASGDSAATESTRAAFDPAVPIVGEVELGLAGADLLDRAAKGTLVNTPETNCPFEALDEGLYELPDKVIVDVLITVDHETSRIVALDPDTCAVVAVSPIP